MEALRIQRDGEQLTVVKRVHLRDFRNYAALDVDLSPGFNILAGPNAQGKTNFLEAIYLLSTSRLLRGQRDAEAIREGQDRAVIEAELAPMGTVVGFHLDRGTRKRALLNRLPLPRAADLIGRLPCVCVSSADLEMVRGEPSDRRLFLDLELSGLYPAYLRHLSHYKRAIEQRNSLLRLAQERSQPAEVFEPWENQIAEHGAPIRRMRRAYLGELLEPAQAVHFEMGDGEQLEVHYEAKETIDEPDAMREALAMGRGHDIHRGGTSVGPHRDELRITIDGREARLFGSQGQQRTAVIAIKMATLAVGARELGQPPLLLLDDILSDLDERRRRMLVEMVLKNAVQAVLTCTEPEAAGERILSQAKVFRVRTGEVSAA